jgi:hypothetical protein
MVAVLAGMDCRDNSPETASAMLGSAGWVKTRPEARGAARLGNLLRRMAVRSSTLCRQRRARLFVDRLQPTQADQILDLGGGRGGHIAEIVPFRATVSKRCMSMAEKNSPWRMRRTTSSSAHRSSST